MIESSELLDTLKKDCLSISDIFQNQFLNLSIDQLNWKPDSNSWSISECLEHIMLSGQFYIDEINKSFLSHKPENLPLNANFKPGLIGNYSAKSMKPRDSGEIKNKMKTFSRMEPGKSGIDTKKLFMDFRKYQDDILLLIEKARYYNLNTLKINSSIGRIIRFKLGDAFRFIIAHNQRHIQQAINVLQMDEFPVS